jgi:hypothetical protein
MRVKPWIAFLTTLPDDQVEEGLNIVLFGGRNVALALGEVLASLDCKVSEPEHAAEDGWEFDLVYKGRHRFWCRVISFHPAFNVLFQDPGSWTTARRNAAAYAELALKLSAALRKDPRFRHVSWWSLKDDPPEPEKIGLIDLRKRAGGDPSSPIDLAGKEGGRPRWGCLAFALCVAASGAVALTWLVAGGPPMKPGEAIFCGLSLLVAGLFGLVRAWSERVEG